MADIATLGIAIDASKVEATTKSLDKLSVSAKNAEQSTKSLGTNSISSITKIAPANDNAVRSFNLLSAAVGLAVGAVAAFGLSLGAALVAAMTMGDKLDDLNKKLKDAGVSAVNPLRQAFEGLSDTINGAEFSKFSEGIKDALAVAAGGALQLLVAGFQGLLEILPIVGEYALVAGGALLIAFSPAILSGILALAGAIGGALLGAVMMLAAALLTPIGAFTAIMVAAYAFRDEINNLLGVDIVAGAKAGANFIIGAFIFAYDNASKIWAAFPAVIGAAATGAANLAISAVEGIINAGVKGLNALISAASSLSEKAGLGKIGNVGEVSLPRVENKSAESLSTQFKGMDRSALSADHIGAAGVAFDKAAKSARSFFSAAMGKDAEGGAGGAAAQDPFAEIVMDAEQFIQKQEVLRQSIGMSEEATRRLKYETTLFQQAQQAGLTLTDDQANQLRGLAVSMAEAETKTKDLRSSFDFAKSTTSGFFSDLKSGLTQGKSLWESFSSAASKALDKITDKLLNDVVNALFRVDDASKGGGGLGGIFGSIFGSIFGGGAGKVSGASLVGGIPVPNAAFANGGIMSASGSMPLNMYSSGGIANSPQMAMFGEGRTPEAYVPLPDGRRIPVNMNMQGAGGGVQNVHVTVGVSVDNNGNLMPFVQSVSQKVAGNVVASAAPQIVRQSVDASSQNVQVQRANNPSYLMGA